MKGCSGFDIYELKNLQPDIEIYSLDEDVKLRHFTGGLHIDFFTCVKGQSYPNPKKGGQNTKAKINRDLYITEKCFTVASLIKATDDNYISIERINSCQE